MISHPLSRHKLWRQMDHMDPVHIHPRQWGLLWAMVGLKVWWHCEIDGKSPFIVSFPWKFWCSIFCGVESVEFHCFTNSDNFWLVVWNIFYFPYIGNNHPSWLIFFRRFQTTNQWWFLFHCLFHIVSHMWKSSKSNRATFGWRKKVWYRHISLQTSGIHLIHLSSFLFGWRYIYIYMYMYTYIYIYIYIYPNLPNPIK